jgi:hypothetical protein
VRLLVTAVAVSAVLAVGACSGDVEESAPPATHTMPSALPLDAYLPTAEQAVTLAKARYLATVRCMTSYGIDWPMPEPTAAGFPFENDRWPLFLDERDAAERGFDPPGSATEIAAARQQSEQAWDHLTPDGQAVYVGWDQGVRSRIQQPGQQLPIIHEYRGKAVPAAGCLGEVQAALRGSAPPLTPPADMGEATTADDNMLIVAVRVGTLSTEANQRAEQSPQYAAMITQWHACMKDAGFEYATPEQARGDNRWVEHPADSQEIAVAKAYARCLRAADYLAVAGDLRAKEEKSLIAAHGNELSKIRAAVDAATATATVIVQG